MAEIRRPDFAEGRTKMFRLVEMSYARIPDYIGYLSTHSGLIGAYGDLKDVQRPWVAKKLSELVPAGASVIDMGGSACELASFLMDTYRVTVVDPYDGSGNGPVSAAAFAKKYPKLNIVTGLVTRGSTFPGSAAVISTSVVEHIDNKFHSDTVSGIHDSLEVGGFSIHAIDITCQGVNGFLEKNKNLCHSWLSAHGIDCEIEEFSQKMIADLETYFLPVTMYVRWKKDKEYKTYPWRKVGSLQFVAQKI
jgi:hypothetical protein